MKVAFSSCQKNYVEDYLSKSCFDWLSKARKEKVKIWAGKGSCRVQDPMMYPKPKIEIYTKEAEADILSVD